VKIHLNIVRDDFQVWDTYLGEYRGQFNRGLLKENRSASMLILVLKRRIQARNDPKTRKIVFRRTLFRK